MALVVLCGVLLTACGGASSADPDPTSTPPPTVAPTLPPGAITVGSLLDRMYEAWTGVSSMRTTFWSTTGEIGTPPAAGPVTIEEIVLPGNRHIVQIVAGTIVDEQLVVDGRIYMKGTLVPAAIAPMMDANTWVEVDPAAATSTSPIAQQVAYLLSPITSPVGAVSTETRGLQAIVEGEITIGERACTAYTFGDGGIQYELAVDGNHLPCRLAISAPGTANVTLYEFNVPGLVLEAPAIATPIAP